MKTLVKASAVSILISLGSPAWAQAVEVQGAWARATVPGQKATGAYMILTAATGAKLISASSPAAGAVEVHEMKMEGDIMRMRALPLGLELPAGRAVDLAPGGYHIMLMDLKGALAKDSVVPLTLWFKDAKGVESRLELKLPVAARASGATANPAAHEHKH